MAKKRTITFEVAREEQGLRLDQTLARRIPDASRSMLQRWIREQWVTVDGTVEDAPRFLLKTGMCVALTEPEVSAPEAVAEPFTFPILFEDDDFLVIDKPPGVVVHPAAGNPSGTVVNALLGRYPDWAARHPGDESRPGIVHRLDKDTSGCLAVAKNSAAQFKLAEAFSGRVTRKKYLALVRGVPKTPTGEIDLPIGRHPVNRQKMAVEPRRGKEAHTVWRLLASGELCGSHVALLEVAIFTGRTHQIRVHLSHIGFPVLGDELYGGSRTAIAGATRQMLHAWKLDLPHPKTGEMRHFVSPVPADMAALIRELPLDDESARRLFRERTN